MESWIQTSIVLGLSVLASQAIAAEIASANDAKTLPAVVVKDKQFNTPVYAQPGGIGHVISLEVDAAPASITRLDDLLIDAGVMTGDANTSLGLSAGLNARGFSVLQQNSSVLTASKVFLNGHPDIAWRFSRDPATVTRVDVLSGHDSTFLGAGSPGAFINFISKTPEGYEFKRVNLGLASNGAKRLVTDAEIHFGPLQVRGVMEIGRAHV